MTFDTFRDAFSAKDELSSRWLIDHGWCAVPVAEYFHAGSQCVPRIVQAASARGIHALYGLELDGVQEDMTPIAPTQKGVCDWLGRVPRASDSVMSAELPLIVLSPRREVFVIASVPEVVEQILGLPVDVAIEAYRKVAEMRPREMGEMPGYRTFYMRVYEHYRTTCRTARDDNSHDTR